MLTRAQRQTLMSNFFQLDRLVVEGQASGRQKGRRGDLARVKDTGWAIPRRRFCKTVLTGGHTERIRSACALYTAP